MKTARGTKDIDPEDMLLKNSVANGIVAVFERYGYVPLDTPVLERIETLSAKYAGGAEILKETFSLKDQGSRELGLRYDLTVPLARYVGANPDIKLPFKRYQIGPVFRDGPIKLGRYRQFTQCDADIIGSSKMLAEAELLQMALDVFGALELSAVIKVNNRKLLNGLLLASGVEKDEQEDVILILDKIEKVGKEQVEKELGDVGVSKDVASKLFSAVDTQGSNAEKLEAASRLVTDEEGKEGVEELQQLVPLLGDKIDIDFRLARGLSYYTGTVFEAFLVNSDISSSIAGGGRYDKMVGDFLQSKIVFPAIGISFGIDVIMDAIRDKKSRKTTAKVFVIAIGVTQEAFQVARELRKAGVNTSVDLMQRGISKNLQYANNLGIPYVVIVGKEELEQKKIKLRNMETGDEELLTIQEAIQKL